MIDKQINVNSARAVVAVASLMAFSGTVFGQSLFLVSDHTPAPGPGASQPLVAPAQVSLLWVPEPEPRVFQKHDIITILIDEVSSQTSSQSLETEKDSRSTTNLNAMLSLAKLLEFRVEQGDTSNVNLIDFAARRQFTGEGDYERRDRFTARITATVLEVKPNGALVLEATKRIAKDDEIQTIVLSGMVREEDITRQNTVLSSQMAGLNIVSTNEGQLRDAAKKGIITEVLDALFAF